MAEETLSGALEREHHEIDGGIEAFLEKLDAGSVQPEPLTAALDQLRRHIYIEERLLFPPIRQGGLVMPIFVMIREHGEIWATMDALTDQLAAGADPDQLRQTGRQLLSQLEQHNGKEEPVIYPHADAGLSAAAGAELAEFIADGLMPDSWVCEKAPG